VRIIQVLHSHGFGGAERHALLLMQGLLERGHAVIYAGPSDSWLAEQCQQNEIEVYHLRMSGMYDLFSHIRLRKLVRGWQPDIIHGHLLRGARYTGCAAAGIAPAVCTAHATTAGKHMGKCRRIIAVSNAVRKTLLGFGYPDEKISVIHNGVPDIQGDSRESARSELGISTDTAALLNAGRFIRDKGQDILVAGFKDIPDIHLYLAGDPSTSFGREVMKSAEGSANIHFIGYHPDIQRLLPAFDGYISASRRESFGLSLVEASAAGLPVIAADVGGVPEVILDGETGLLFPSENTLAMKMCVMKLFADSGKRKESGLKGRLNYLEHFTVEKMVSGTEEFYIRIQSAHANDSRKKLQSDCKRFLKGSCCK